MYDTEEQKNKILIIRNLTGFPSWDISKALQKCNWDTNQAIALLKKYGGLLPREKLIR